MGSGGDRGRVVLGMVGLDQHEVGALAVSHLLSRAGFEVIYLGPFNTAASLVETAMQEDADVVGISAHSWEFEAHVDDLVRGCHERGVSVVVGGSVLTEADRADLQRRGVDAVFLAYASEAEIVEEIDRLIANGGGEANRADPDRPLAGRVAIVTGAARGLGRCYVDRLRQDGAMVVASDIDGDALTGSCTPEAGSLTTVVADISTKPGVDEVMAAALDTFGRVDGVVANAGILRSGPILHLEEADVDAVLAVHVRGTFLLAQAAGAYWRSESREGRAVDASLVTTSSAAGLYGFRAEALYSAAKAAVASFTLVAADEFARFSARVNSIAPLARTRLTPWMDAGDEALDASHVAPLVAWLLSGDSAGVTGRVFEIGGGTVSLPAPWTARPGHALTARTSWGELDRTLRRLIEQSTPPGPILGASAGATPAHAVSRR